jgi:hypothetical protein
LIFSFLVFAGIASFVFWPHPKGGTSFGISLMEPLSGQLPFVPCRITITNQSGSTIKIFNVYPSGVRWMGNYSIPPTGKIVGPGQSIECRVDFNYGKLVNYVDISFSEFGVRQKIADWAITSSNRFILSCAPASWTTNVIQVSKDNVVFQMGTEHPWRPRLTIDGRTFH